ncbi:hypothetical protein ACWCQK_03495 [Streptomyces sp. NPDC002306]
MRSPDDHDRTRADADHVPARGSLPRRIPHRHAYEILHGVRFTLMVPNRRLPPAKG